MLELQTALMRETKRARFLEFASLGETSVTRTQIEIRGNLVFMRAKKRNYAFS
jgi:hypothetical protein